MKAKFGGSFNSRLFAYLLYGTLIVFCLDSKLRPHGNPYYICARGLREFDGTIIQGNKVFQFEGADKQAARVRAWDRTTESWGSSETEPGFKLGTRAIGARLSSSCDFKILRLRVESYDPGGGSAWAINGPISLRLFEALRALLSSCTLETDENASRTIPSCVIPVIVSRNFLNVPEIKRLALITRVAKQIRFGADQPSNCDLRVTLHRKLD